MDSPELQQARSRAAEFGIPAISPATGATLRTLAATLQAKTVVEVGTGAGVAALYLLAGMAPQGVLTTIDVEAEHQRQAKASFKASGIAPGRTRTILGRPGEVLPRLADSAYDLVLVAEWPEQLAEHVEQGLRLLRPGGVLAITNALWHDQVPDPARRDEPVTALRRIFARIREDESLAPVLLPVGSGLLVASKLR
ncbi:O-methyltransferase [Rarobacter faecitabidus]|uniref:Putative O-methyltransferase YrrM n=1 Tax=Rarobacter faecitabidus TaxID=13243 RepID=A0A542ZUS4_RARFA|nr:O-methyltransferase [Rarobacter faecitabidus]TQL64049.1 putative O-methyltransferase YrrM [Rarobacter faecitabidus]